MKLSLRKTLVAGVTATALTFSSTAYAPAADNTTVTANEDESSSGSSSDDDSAEITPKMIKEYIEIVVSIIRTMDSVFRLFPQPK
ncbi:hypothetical protein CPHO_05490 [Corynebacterium phocae]|uniref:Uncharacterized protein n=1 Tax=Corynebacterium phocae TaxID=161895 RepID=A0A1L7D2V8_9CORY|nr:hypothetical protein [Corynebacterium phocae]APT92425.1 hypothetical protein CPHO_05490 [Corynebacterium phocae]KAA8725025.1 hypothetical protein F4V58_05025 [Corynebacterium phocae]